MKWKEMPAFESAKEFEIGDTVRVYQSVEACDGKVDAISGDLIDVSFVQSAHDRGIYHFKTCRKLVPVEPREWTGRREFFEADSMGRVTSTKYILWIKGIGPETIKVREVLDEE